MLQLLDGSIEAFLRREVPLATRDVDIAFDAPDRDWGAGVTKPTINLYLWDVRRNLNQREVGWMLVEEEGERVRRSPDPRIDCRYLVTAWTSETRDEHALLGTVLGTLLRHPELPGEDLKGALAEVRPLPTLSLGPHDGRDESDFWSALGGQLKPGLDLAVTATVDEGLARAAGPPVHTRDVRLRGFVPTRDGRASDGDPQGNGDGG